MQPNLKQYADYFSMGLELGVCSHAEVISWVDHLIGHSEKIEDWMIDLSTSQGGNILDVLHILRGVSGMGDLNISFKLLLAKLKKLHRTISPESTKILGRLYQFVHSEISDDFKAHLYKIDSALDWLDCGGDWSAVKQDYEELLALGSDFKSCVN